MSIYWLHIIACIDEGSLSFTNAQDQFIADKQGIGINTEIYYQQEF